MFLSRRILGRVGRGGRKKKLLRIGSRREIMTPTHFLCPISLDLMKDPVTLSTGISYDRENIEKWLGEGNRTCPVTNQVLTSYDLIPNHAIRRMIQEWCVDNRSHGIERIPTPRIPVSSSQVSEMCARLEAATGCRDHGECLELLGKMKGLAKESERDKKCIAENGAGRVLSACFQTFSMETDKYEDLLKEVLSALKWMFPVGEESKSMLGSKPSLRCMAWILKGQDSSAKRNVVIVLKKLLSLDHTYANVLAQVDEDVPQALFEMVKSPSCPSARKAPLEVMNRMVASSVEANGKLVKMGLPSLVLEILVDAEKGVAEKALAVLDGICDSQEGRGSICTHPLTMALLVKKIMRISEMGTELCVSIMWKLCKGEDENENHVIEALELGAFQKLLVVLQVGCGENTKERATELLKLMNFYQDRVQCLHNSSGFKYLKKSY